MAQNLVSGSSNIYIGTSNYSLESATSQYEIVIGDGVTGHGSNTCTLGDVTGLNSIDPSVTLVTDLGTSDYQFKHLYASGFNNGTTYTFPGTTGATGNYLGTDGANNLVFFNQPKTALLWYDDLTNVGPLGHTGVFNYTKSDDYGNVLFLPGGTGPTATISFSEYSSYLDKALIQISAHCNAIKATGADKYVDCHLINTGVTGVTGIYVGTTSLIKNNHLIKDHIAWGPITYKFMTTPGNTGIGLLSDYYVDFTSTDSPDLVDIQVTIQLIPI